jgi:hypothetical protein
MLSKLDHIQLTMPKGEEAQVRAFCTLLGLIEIPKPATLAKRGGAWFVLPDGFQIHYGVEVDFMPARKAHPAFVCDDLDGMAKRLMEAHFMVIWDEELAPRRRFYSADPFGNRLEFMEVSS